MGVPKFFRYISERYPCLSELIKEYQIPEFDNLYLDMNGIIHVCSHPDNYDPHLRISEEKMFTDIFHYIEVLFRMIKPQRLFFMAVDGVAPRAKMNQQRGRRFRSAKEADVLEAKAREKGEVLPDEARFDSNCITPGTVFMARLHEQLKYFVSYKISTDKLWQKCKIILSGHETPGEGEHKIMDYIRYMKSQTGYDPNTRHCLYGLDADLIMLGLCTHEPHFSLLREEIRFGKKAKRKNIPEEINFYLLHLSLMREYLELEFLPLKESLPFEYDMEKIIDDWVLMGFLVGNDFIPNLPNMHITNGALPVLYNAYMKVLPTLDGYINESGSLNLNRFEKFMSALSSIDLDHFSEQYADLKYFQSKTGRKPNSKERTSYKPKELEVWLPDDCDNADIKTTNKELQALIKSTDDLLLDDAWKSNTIDVKENNLQIIDLDSNIEETNLLVDIFSSSDETKSESNCNKDEQVKVEDTVLLEPSESNLADLALDDNELHDDEEATSPYYSESDSDDELINAEFIQHKNDYYMNKLDYLKVTPEVMRDQAEGYVRAIQWNLHYYYNGVCSWSWYYPHHYAPYISDIKGFSDLKLDFELGVPFKPFEQLLAVLPAASKSLLPIPYQELMTEENSPIIDYYPQEFRTDLNGKRQEWEAVVLIPFIDETLLLNAMSACNEKLTEEEKKRNSHGPMIVYNYTTENLGTYNAPDYYPNIEANHAKTILMSIEDIKVPIEKLIKGPCPGSIHDVYYPGFPTFKHLKYNSHLEKAKVRVFDCPSQNDNMIVKIVRNDDKIDIEVLAKELLGKIVYVSWPHLTEAQVVTVSDHDCRYHKTSVMGEFNLECNKGNLAQLWLAQKQGITLHYKEKFGINVGQTNILIHVKILIGKKYVYYSDGRVYLEKQWANIESCYPLQSVIQKLNVYDSTKKYNTIQELFPITSKCFMIGHPHYGSMGEIIDNVTLKSGRLKVNMFVLTEPDLTFIHDYENSIKYLPCAIAAQRLSISSHLLSRITGTILVVLGVKGSTVPKNSNKLNIGLNLKLNKKNEEIPGYTRKVDGLWLYSKNSVNLVKRYIEFCPELFTYIASHLGNDMFYESEIFPDNIGEGKVQKLVDWIKKQPHTSVAHQKVGCQTVQEEVVKKIEETVDLFNSKEKKSKHVIMQVKPHLLYKHEVQSGQLPPDSSATYQLYDRVINVRESYTVPLGYKGTVIGILKTESTTENDVEVMYDVLFDESFPGGLQLNCSPNRGYRLPKTALINISHGMRVLQQKTINPANNSPWYGKTPVNQNHNQVQQVQSPNSAFASWNSTNPNNFYHQQHHQQQQQQQRMFTPPHYVLHQSMHAAAPSFNTLMNHHPRMPIHQSQKSLQNNQGVSSEFHAFLEDLQKNQNKGKQRFNQTPNQIKSKSNESESDAAEALKKMLNISNQSANQNKNQQTSSTSDGNTVQPISVQDFFAHARNKEQNFAQSSKQPTNTTYYSVQLLNYCQAHRIGIPRYNYLSMPTNKIRAQITLPDGRSIIGDESISKEKAAENAAKIIMNDMLQTKPSEPQMKHMPHPIPSLSTSNIGPKGFPVPPKQWCQNQTQKSQKLYNKPQNVTDPKHVLVNGTHSRMQREDAKPSGATPFIPLQAVKQQRNKSSTNTTAVMQKENVNNAETAAKCTETKSNSSSNKTSTPQSSSASVSPPKRRTRRNRIAANFSGWQSNPQ